MHEASDVAIHWLKYTVTIEEEEYFRIDNEVRCEGAHPLCGALSQQGLNPIKLAYDTRRPDGRSHNGQRL